MENHNKKDQKHENYDNEFDFQLWKKTLDKQLGVFWNLMTKMMEIGSVEERNFLEYLIKKYAGMILLSGKNNKYSS